MQTGVSVSAIDELRRALSGSPATLRSFRSAVPTSTLPGP